jgi:hypothetical protein
MDKIDNEEGYIQTRKTIDMCWDWLDDQVDPPNESRNCAIS